MAAHATEGAKNHEKWRHEQIKLTLRAETNDKCAYCESFIADVAYPHVEHIVPKSLHPELAHTWHNLTWACPRCNVSKDVAYHPTAGVLNPYVDTIEEHLEFYGDLVDCPLGSQRGEATIIACDLNRYELLRSRVARLRAIRQMAERWNAAIDPMRTTIESAIRLDAAQGEYSAHVSAYLRKIGFPLDAQ
ncbi:HNH endonuclease [Terrabacter sp. NPDC080008]|uniref:HNH endonuclease n=1 Tax=Terrabacter sp. NPDC080008 TaxID=3155176 RepID=UPI00344F1F7A